MSAIVFAGPTIGPQDVAALCPCLCLPPAAQGDVYRATLRKPRAIAVVDGYFHGVPAVWHKEILWAMAQGIHVFGASSMGALRAAELHDFGMRGVGWIYEQFLTGALEDDDEVAVLHAPAEIGYAPLSEAMVNIRATLARAAAEGVVSAAAADALCAAAKATFYQQRDWDTLLSSAAGPPVDADEAAALRAWLPAGRIDQKRVDAEAMLAALQAFLVDNPALMAVGYSFEWTHLWDSVVADGVPAHVAEETDAAPDPEPVLDELRLDPARFRAVRRSALLRLMASGQGPRPQVPDGAAMRAARSRFQAERGLFGRDALDAWLAASGIDQAGFDALIDAEARIDSLLARADAGLAPCMLAELRAQGLYTPLEARARAKRSALAARDDTGAARTLPPLHLLAEWFFETHLAGEVPDDLDAYVRDLGLHSREALARILAYELSFQATLGGSDSRSAHD